MSHSDKGKVWLLCSVIADLDDQSVTWIGTGTAQETEDRPLVIRMTDSWAADVGNLTAEYIQAISSLYRNYTLHMEGLRSEHPSGKKDG